MYIFQIKPGLAWLFVSFYALKHMYVRACVSACVSACVCELMVCLTVKSDCLVCLSVCCLSARLCDCDLLCILFQTIAYSLLKSVVLAWLY